MRFVYLVEKTSFSEHKLSSEIIPFSHNSLEEKKSSVSGVRATSCQYVHS
jgi:hypothetical protein